MKPFDLAIARIASGQYALITKRQATEAGMPEHVLEHRLRSGKLLLIVRGVYRFPEAPLTWHQRLMAAVLAAGPGAAASHRAATALWGVPGFRSGIAEVARLRRPHKPARIGVLHETVVPFAVVVRECIPVTSPARTLCDVAMLVTPKRLERAVDSALAMNLVTVGQLSGEVAKLGWSRKGTAAMRRILAERGPGYRAPDSELEAHVLDLIAGAGLPAPVRQLRLGDERFVGRADLVYPAERLIIEVDSRTYHESKLDSEADKVRDAEMAAGGFRTVRVTRAKAYKDPGWVVSTIAKALRRPA